MLSSQQEMKVLSEVEYHQCCYDFGSAIEKHQNEESMHDEALSLFFRNIDWALA